MVMDNVFNNLPVCAMIENAIVKLTPSEVTLLILLLQEVNDDIKFVAKEKNVSLPAVVERLFRPVGFVVSGKLILKPELSSLILEKG
jgi:hypothetical protein